MLTIQSSSSGANGSKQRIRTLVAAESAVTRGGVSVLLGTQKDIEVVATVYSEFDMLRNAEQLRPDLVVLEHSILSRSGFQSARRLRRVAPGVRVMVFMDSSGTLAQDPCLEAGADSCIQKDQIPEGLISEIRRLFPDAPVHKHMQMKKGA
jgi:DNA-binding NarL/FixJ family response regulator